MRYLTILIFTLLFTVSCLTSCGGNDAAVNNGSDTGVAGITNDAMEDVERKINDATDGTIFDANGEHSNVDEYQGNGYYNGMTGDNLNNFEYTPAEYNSNYNQTTYTDSYTK